MTKEDVIKFLEDNLIDNGSGTGVFHYQLEGDSFDWHMIYGGCTFRGENQYTNKHWTFYKSQGIVEGEYEEDDDWYDFEEFNKSMVIKIIKTMLK